MSTQISVKNVEFRKFVKTEKSGARILGFIRFILVVAGEELPYADLKVRINAKGTQTLCAPSRNYKNSDDEWRSSAAYRFSDETYSNLVRVFFKREDVQNALNESASADEQESLSA